MHITIEQMAIFSKKTIATFNVLYMYMVLVADCNLTHWFINFGSDKLKVLRLISCWLWWVSALEMIMNI